LGLRVRGEIATTTPLPRSGLLIFYSDGLIEADRDVVRGYKRLRAALARPEIANSSSPAGALYRAMLKRGVNDDVVVLALRLEAPETDAYDGNGEGARRWTFDSKDAARAHAARRSFVEILRDAGLRQKQLDAAELVFGELLGNVVRFAPGPVEIVVDWTRGTAPVLHVLDRGPGFTFMPKLPLDPLSERGRGIYIAWSLAEELNVTLRHGGGAHARAVLAIV
jgi:anti-sigma regulatory factor (Ser/Thr protein kinase)